MVSALRNKETYSSTEDNIKEKRSYLLDNRETYTDRQTSSLDRNTQLSFQKESGTVEFQRFEAKTWIYAITARQAGRLNAASVTESELERLMAERRKLVQQELDGEISPENKRRLTYIGWHLDRIFDARNGGALDTLEAHANILEQFSSHISVLNRQINQLIGKKT